MTESSLYPKINDDYIPNHEEKDFLKIALNHQAIRFDLFSDFGSALEGNKSNNIANIIHESKLPRRKVVILFCMLEEISTNSDQAVVNFLATSAIYLSSFQSGFAEGDLPAMPDSLTRKRHPLAFWRRPKKADLLNFAENVAKSEEMLTALTQRSSEEARLLYQAVEAAKKDNPHLNPWWTRSQTQAHVPVAEVPLTGSTPDIFDAEPFWSERHGRFSLLAFRAIAPLAVRNGGRAVITYPLVMAAFEPEAGRPAFLVTVETGSMANGSFLCGFDGTGRHLNYGQWDDEAGEKAFLERAMSVTTGVLDRLIAA